MDLNIKSVNYGKTPVKNKSVSNLNLILKILHNTGFPGAFYDSIFIIFTKLKSGTGIVYCL